MNGFVIVGAAWLALVLYNSRQHGITPPWPGLVAGGGVLIYGLTKRK